MEATAREPKTFTEGDVLAIAERAQTDPSALDELTTGLLSALIENGNQTRRIEYLERDRARLAANLKKLLDRLYGKKSEKIDPNQLLLFVKEAFEGTVSKMECPAPDAPSEPKKRKPAPHGRNSFPDHLPRNRVEIEPPKDDCICPDCQNSLVRIGEEITERGHYTPGSWTVNQYVRGSWACKKSCGGVVTADLPKALVDKAKHEPSVAISSAISKYADHLPLERQSEIHERLGMTVSPSTLGDGVAALAELHAATVDQMRVETLAEPTIHADDTPVKTLVENPDYNPKSSGASNKKKVIREGRIWVYLAMTGKVFYDFTLGKSHGGPLAILKDFHGRIVVDGAPNFNEGIRAGKSLRGGCWAHVRRKVKESLDSFPQAAASLLLMINRLFRIERAIVARRNGEPSFDDDAVTRVRKRRSKPLLDKIHERLLKLEANVLPHEPLGEAVAYTLKQWSALVLFLDYADVAIHNNAAENALRAIAVGRKNYLFFGSENGGKTAAVLYSLIGTCKVLGVDPYAYLTETTAILIKEPTLPRSEVTPWAWAKKRGDRIMVEAKEDAAAAAAQTI